MNQTDQNPSATSPDAPTAKDDHHHIKRGLWLLAAITALLLLLSWVIIHWDLDRLIAGFFYSPEDGWYLRDQKPWTLVYRYGTIPGLLLTLCALVGWFVCLIKPKLRHLHRTVLVVVLTAIIGPGVLVNGIIKGQWARPRPRQVVEFGGQWQYRHISQPGVPGKGKSFPCGHCTMGFLFFGLIAFRRKWPWLAFCGATLGVVLGVFVSATRIIQGAHFPADCLWSAGIVGLVLVSLYYLILQVPKPRRIREDKMSRTTKRWVGIGLAAAAVVITTGFMLHRPFYDTHVYPLEVQPNLRRMMIRVDADIERFAVHYDNQKSPRIVMDAWGFAWTGVKHRMQPSRRVEEEQQLIELAVTKQGYFAELTHEINLYLPEQLRGRVDVRLIDRGGP